MSSENGENIKSTPEWKALCGRYARINKSIQGNAFGKFLDFYHRSMENGFEPYAKLVLIDESKPYSPDNCKWIPPVNQQEYTTEEHKLWIKKWNKTVNKIRKHYGMRPLPRNGGNS